MSLVVTSETRGHHRRVLLLDGQVAVVGSSPWSDFFVPDDSLAQAHFWIVPGSSPLVRACDECQLFVENMPVKAIEYRTQVSFEAGNTIFEVEAQPAVAQLSLGSDQFAAGAHSDFSDTQEALDLQSAIDRSCPPIVLSELDLSKQSLKVATLANGRIEATAELLLIGQTLDALKVWIVSQPLSAAIRQVWELFEHHQRQGSLNGSDKAAGGLGNEQPTNQDQMIQASDVRAWCQTPSEQHRRKVSHHAVASPANPLEWICKAIEWTGGSLADPQSPMVSPPAHLPVLALCSAVQLHCVVTAHPLPDLVSALSGVNIPPATNAA